MLKMSRAIYAFLNRRFPEHAYHFVAKAPGQLEPSLQQLQLMEACGIYCIRLEYRRNVGRIVQRSYWSTGEKDGFLPLALHELPRDVLLIKRNASGKFEVHAGPGYNDMSAAQFEEVLSRLLETARESIAYTATLRQRPQG